MRVRELDDYKNAKKKMLEDKKKLRKEMEDNLVRIDKDELAKLNKALEKASKNKALESGEVK